MLVKLIKLQCEKCSKELDVTMITCGECGTEHVESTSEDNIAKEVIKWKNIAWDKSIEIQDLRSRIQVLESQATQNQVFRANAR